jgi:hypothetical protein
MLHPQNSAQMALIGDYVIEFATKIKFYRQSDDEYLVRPVGKGTDVIRMNGSAASVYKACKSGRSIAQVLRELLKNLEEPPTANVVDDIHSILLSFEQSGLIRFRPTGAAIGVEQASGRVASKKISVPVDNRFRLISHRRSGTHFLWELMRLNLGAGSTDQQSLNDIPKSHQSWSSGLESRYKETRSIYLIRDARDVLVANYYYWKNGGERQIGVNLSFSDVSFQDFLQGKVPLDDVPDNYREFAERYFRDPIGYWLGHTEWATRLFTVKYENLLSEPINTLSLIAGQFELRFDPENYKNLDSLVGHYPRKGVVGDWRTMFSESDHDNFWSRAYVRMNQLGYTLQD